MLLSEVLKQYFSETNIKYEIRCEKAFDTLALLASDVEMQTCTFLDSEKYLNDIKSNVTMLMTTNELAEMLSDKDIGLCIVESPRILFFELHNALAGNTDYVRSQRQTTIGTGCNIDDTAVIAKNNVVIGNNVTIEEFVVIRENTVIGDNTVIRAGVKIGGEGFEFKRKNDSIEAVKHLGGVIIGKNVEIQYNTCVDKAVYPWDDTCIGDFTKIDNLVHIGHAVKIASKVMIVAQVGIGGRTIIGDNSWIGFSSTIINGIVIGKDARANIGSVVTKSVSDGGSVTGNFAIEHKRFIQNLKNQTKEE